MPAHSYWTSPPVPVVLKIAATGRNLSNSGLGVPSTAAISQASSSGGTDDTGFRCPFNCPRKFPTKIGHGLHKRKAHQLNSLNN